MKEQNEMDRMLKDSLANFRPEPHPEGRRRFLEEAPAALGRRPGGRARWIPITLGLIATLIIGTLIYTAIINQEPSASRGHSGILTQPGEGSATADNPQFRPASEVNTASLPSDTSGPGSEILEEDEKSGVPASSNTKSKDLKKNTGETIPGTGDNPAAIAGLTDSGLSPVRNFTPLDEIKSHFQTAFVENEKEQEAIRDPYSRKISPSAATPGEFEKMSPHASYGIFYKPDMMFRIVDENKVVHSAGAEVQIRFPDPRFLIRTGLGFSFSKGFNEYNVNYNEYLGSYFRLDSVTFSLGENNFDLIAQVHQSEQQVYDTAVEALPAKTYQRFTYLQVPLTGGYDFVTLPNLSIGARLGAVMSVMLSSNLGQVNYDAGNNQVIGVDQLTPERKQLNWQAVAGVTFTLRGPKRSYIELEPAFSYYLNAIHQEASGSEHPYSIGLRLAVGIK
jgi:hypothetical protein